MNIFPELGGKTASDSDSVQAGYTVGYHKLTSIFNANWNRSDSQAHQLLHQRGRHRHADRDSRAGRQSAQRQPAQLRPAQCDVSAVSPGSASSSRIHHRADHLDLRNAGLDTRQAQLPLRRRLPPRASRFSGRLDSTGTFYFTGVYTGSSLGDFLLGLPQETSIDSPRRRAICATMSSTVCAGRLARALEPDADVWRPLRILRALHGKVRPPGRCGYESRRADLPASAQVQARQAPSAACPIRWSIRFAPLLRRGLGWRCGCPSRLWFAPATA